MECPACKGELRFLHSYDAGHAGRTVERRCENCGRKHVFAEVLVGQVDKRGSGAYALAQRLRRGEAPTPLQPDENQK